MKQKITILLFILQFCTVKYIDAQNCTFNINIDNSNSVANFTATDTLSSYAYIFIVDTTNVLTNITGGHIANFQSTINDVDTHSVCLKIVDLINQIVICEVCTTFNFSLPPPPSPNCNFTYYFSNDTLYTALAGNLVPAQFVWNINGQLIGGQQLNYYTGNIDSIQVTLTGSTTLGTSCSNSLYAINPGYIPQCNDSIQQTNNLVVFKIINPIAGNTTTWNFGNGYITTGNIVTHAYNNLGTYYTSATTVNSAGAVVCQSFDTVIVSSITPNVNCNFYSTITGDNLHLYTNLTVPNVTYTWYLSNGDTIQSPTVDLSIAYLQSINIDTLNVTLTIFYNGYSCISSDAIEIPQTPTVNFCDVNFNHIAIGKQLYVIDGTTSNNPNHSNYKWDFGDGNFSYYKNTQHYYVNSGTYNVCLIVKDTVNPYLCNDSICQPIVISDTASIADSCQAFFVYTQLQPYYIGIVNMVTALNPQFTWNFDDGPNSVINSSFPSYTYQQAGTYNICLTINSNGCVDTFCDSLTVDSLGIIGRYSQTGFSINVVSPEEITNNNPAAGILSMQGAKQSQMRCYPNPAKDFLNVSVKGKVQNAKLSITDIVGNEIEVQNSKSKVQSDATLNFELSILHLKAGIYFVKYGNETLKFIKQ